MRATESDDEDVVELNVDYVRQREEMEKLYGAGTDKVVEAETEMQTKFDQMCAEHDPVLWPCLPLNMKFD